MIFLARIDAEELAESAEEIGHRHGSFGDGGPEFVSGADDLSAFDTTTGQSQIECRREMIAPGREIDVVCSGASSLRGEVMKVEGGVLELKDDEDQICYVAVDKIIAVWEKRDKERHPGFMFKS